MPGILIITVGSSPLPVIVSILHLNPATVHLVYTPDVQQVVERMCAHLKEKLPGCCCKSVEVREHRMAAKIRNRLETEADLRNRWSECSLNYTGGTKLMAVHTHALWTEKGGQKRNASYLAADGKLYFDDPIIDPIPEYRLPRLTLDELCELHFGKKPHTKGDEHLDSKRLDLARKIHQFVCDKGVKCYQELLPPLYCESDRE